MMAWPDISLASHMAAAPLSSPRAIQAPHSAAFHQTRNPNPNPNLNPNPNPNPDHNSNQVGRGRAEPRVGYLVANPHQQNPTPLSQIWAFAQWNPISS